MLHHYLYYIFSKQFYINANYISVGVAPFSKINSVYTLFLLQYTILHTFCNICGSSGKKSNFSTVNQFCMKFKYQIEFYILNWVKVFYLLLNIVFYLFLPFDKCFCVVHFARTKCALHFSFADVALLKDAALKLLILMDKTKICAAFENLEK